MYELSISQYGRPEWSIGISTDQQFTRLKYDVGYGNNKTYNPTASVPVSLSWFFTNDQMRLFNQSWRNRSRLAWGSNHFLLELPISLHQNAYPGTPVPDSTVYPVSKYEIEVGEYDLDPNLDGWERSNTRVYGEISPPEPRFMGYPLRRIGPDKADNKIIVSFYNDVRLVDYEPITLGFTNDDFNFAPIFEQAIWNEANQDYRINQTPEGEALWELGNTVQFAIQASQPIWRKYICCPEGSFRSAPIGITNWRVDMSVYVDAAPVTQWLDPEGIIS